MFGNPVGVYNLLTYVLGQGISCVQYGSWSIYLVCNNILKFEETFELSKRMDDGPLDGSAVALRQS